MNKIFKSQRFWLVVIIGALQALVLFNVINTTQSEGLIQIVQTILGAIVAIRTIDRTGDKKVVAANIVAGAPVSSEK